MPRQVICGIRTGEWNSRQGAAGAALGPAPNRILSSDRGGPWAPVLAGARSEKLISGQAATGFLETPVHFRR